MSSTVQGTNVPPISFPGIASGIDYTSIIAKLVSLQLAPTTVLNNQIQQLSSANLEMIKINGMMASVQTSLTSVTNTSLFNTFTATSSSPTILGASQTPGVTATPGVYQILNTQLATQTTVIGAPGKGHSVRDLLGGTPSDQIAGLNNEYTQITATNGTGTQGKVTINGVTVTYDVTSQSLQQILTTINNAVQLQTADPTFNIGYVGATDTIKITDTNNPISLGGAGDTGNLLQVLKLDTAQINNGPTPKTVTASGGVGGINPNLALNSKNQYSTVTDANFNTPVTGGTFSVNGVLITVQNTGNLNDVITSINSSNAGVNATFNTTTGQLTLQNKGTGTQSITLSNGSSNFLTAVGLLGAGATTTLGAQASLTLQKPGGPQTFYGNSNIFSNVIPGITLTVNQTSAVTTSVTVAQDTSGVANALGGFISAYNAAITEINTATAAPQMISDPNSAQNGQLVSPGGILFGSNDDVLGIKDRLVNLATTVLSGNGTSYNSLAAIGVALNQSFTQTQSNGSTQSTSTGTDGTFSALDTTKLAAALAASPTVVSNLINNVSTQFGTYLTGVTGLPTLLGVGFVPSGTGAPLLQSFETSNSNQITSLQQQVQQIQDSANQYADQLRASFVSSEAQIAQLQSIQSQLGLLISSFSGSGQSH